LIKVAGEDYYAYQNPSTGQYMGKDLTPETYGKLILTDTDQSNAV
jgi:hypothetical protein